MNSAIQYIIQFENNQYVLNTQQVEDLLKISKYCYKDLTDGYLAIKLSITLKNKQLFSGYVTGYEGSNPLSPFDVNIPVKFTLKQDNAERIISFLEIERIDIEEHKD